jgi:hypothetical protein
VKRFLELVFAGVVASIVLACQDELTAPVATMLMDAGRTLVDAGANILDGGSADAANGADSSNGNGDGGGDQMSDSGSVSDASAQAPCGTCTVAGPIEVQAPLNVVTADTDVARLKSGVIDPAAGWIQLIAGPFVVTDVHPAAVMASSGASNFVELATAEPGECANTRQELLSTWSSSWVNPGGTAGNAVSGNVTGARYPVPVNRVLCGRGTGFWAGFSPY